MSGVTQAEVIHAMKALLCSALIAIGIVAGIVARGNRGHQRITTGTGAHPHTSGGAVWRQEGQLQRRYTVHKSRASWRRKAEDTANSVPPRRDARAGAEGRLAQAGGACTLRRSIVSPRACGARARRSPPLGRHRPHAMRASPCVMGVNESNASCVERIDHSIRSRYDGQCVRTDFRHGGDRCLHCLMA